MASIDTMSLNFTQIEMAYIATQPFVSDSVELWKYFT